MEISGDNVESLYQEAWWAMHVSGEREISRNGYVSTIQQPVIMTLQNPLKRILYEPVRNCNPFFHIAEVVWMFSGSDDVRFVERFNKRYRQYANTDSHTVHGAYGNRWLAKGDQVQHVINLLNDDNATRRAVIGMWDPQQDLLAGSYPDHPCNTQIMFRVVDDALDMLVTNRSNDLVWGALGANVVHFTYLQEAVARSIAGIRLGKYRVVTNNLHVYEGTPNIENIRQAALNGFDCTKYSSVQILYKDETWKELHHDCVNLIALDEVAFTCKLRTRWAREVARPMIAAYLAKKERIHLMRKCLDVGWLQAGIQWLTRNGKEETL